MDEDLDLWQLSLPIKGDPIHAGLCRELLGAFLITEWRNTEEAARIENVVMEAAKYLNHRLDRR